MTRRKAIVFAWLLVSVWAGCLYLRAALDPPVGRTFAGTFYWIDDFYNYVQYVQQAEDGHLLFKNKLAAPQQARPQLLNLEWLLLGRLSLVLSRRPFLAYRLLALVAALALLAGAQRWLGRLGVGPSHRLPALLLLAFAGGLGGLLFEATDATAAQCLDLSVGLFPYLELLANPHFALATALLLWSLWCFAESRPPWGPLAGIGLGTVLGLVRPYDLALLGLIRGLAVLVTERPAAWFRSLLPLAGLLPVLGYDLWVFFGSSQFAAFRRGSPFPGPLGFAAALGPATLLALAALHETDAGSRRARTHLWVWAALAGVAIATRPPAFSLQFLVGAGVPLLLLGGAALRRFPPAWTTLAALLLSTSAVVSTRNVLAEDPNWFVPGERLAVARALRSWCHPADRLLAPPDISLYAIGLTACHAYVSYSLAPDYPEHLAQARAFYASMSAGERQLMLDRDGLTLLVLPGLPGWRPTAWLGPDTEFRAVATVGAGASRVTVYARGNRPLEARRERLSLPPHE